MSHAIFQNFIRNFMVFRLEHAHSCDSQIKNIYLKKKINIKDEYIKEKKYKFKQPVQHIKGFFLSFFFNSQTNKLNCLIKF